MTSRQSFRGGSAVGQIRDLGPVEAGAVLYLRLWCEGSGSRDRLCADFHTSLGAEVGQQAVRSIDEICDMLLRYGRRPLLRHHLACTCVGADEACFANFIAAASEGDREDAALIATLLVRADLALCLLKQAETVGLALKQMALQAARHGPLDPQNSTLH